MADEKILNEELGEENDGATNTPSEGDNHKEKTQNDKRYTKEDVNDIVRGRINKIFGKYGVNKTEELDKVVEKGKAYDELKTKYDALLEKQVFTDNKIKEDRIDDVKTYFKGKGLQLENNILAEVVKTHPEWVIVENDNNKIEKIGGNNNNLDPQPEDEEEKKAARKLLGI